MGPDPVRIETIHTMMAAVNNAPRRGRSKAAAVAIVATW
jgi:hypothetical protein